MDCPAYNHKCSKCGILHHFDTVRRQAKRKRGLQKVTPSGDITPHDDATAVFHTLRSLSSPSPSLSPTQDIRLDHHVYDDLSQAWEKRASDPQPF